MLKEVKINVAIIRPTKTSHKKTFGKFMREFFMRQNVPLFTALETFEAYLYQEDTVDFRVKPISHYLQDYIQI